MSNTVNPFEAEARNKKVRIMMMTLRASVALVAPKMTLDQVVLRVGEWGVRDWSVLDTLAMVKPSSEETHDQLMRELQKMADESVERELGAVRGWGLGE